MSHRNSPPPAARKFLFDLNDFGDKQPKEEEENLPPPPPTFSEEELARARAESYEEGKRAGHAEENARREKFVAGIVEKIGKNFETLFATEKARAAVFETEAVTLARHIFARTFPRFNAAFGLAEVEQTVRNVLESKKDVPEIVLEVHPDYEDDIRKYTDLIIQSLHLAGRCTVRGNAALGPGDCRMQWENGGAVRDAAGLAAQIEAELQQVLAAGPILRDNGAESDAETMPGPRRPSGKNRKAPRTGTETGTGTETETQT